MAEEESGALSRASACLCILCGLPAAGKTTLAGKVLSSAAQHGWRAGVVCYDDLIPEDAFRTLGKKEEDGRLEEMTDWRSHRQEVLRYIGHFLGEFRVLAELPGRCQINRNAWEQCIGSLLQPKAEREPFFLLLDDNFYYPSMRYEVYQLARKYSLGFCQVYLHCDLESCISRNQSRSKPIPNKVIMEMVERLESPNPQKNPWEKNSISLSTTDNLTNCDIQKVMELMSSALSNPLSPVEDDTEKKEADRLRCATSVVHQADQAYRRLISESMKTAREMHVPPENMRSLAARLNESKTTFLDQLRSQLLQDASLFQEEDVDVERVLKRAVDVFDRGRREILLRFMKE